ncbi:MAG: YmdB family metallophosphoesterase [Candidatus Eremiobacteraeota bacterium]|nr:YmdB family metallophosphoesterase [Candidatus Eremiobacteraeota bacterium]
MRGQSLAVAIQNETGMRALFLGDIVGAHAVVAVAQALPAWRRDRGLDLVIANAENATVSRDDDPRTGFGMSAKAVETLLEAGVDIITGGNHSWDAPDCETVLDSARVLRPHNVAGTLAGHGVAEWKGGGRKIAVVNLIGASAAGRRYTVSNPLAAFDALALDDRHVIVDFHSDSVTEKQTFAHAVDGRVSAVIGTHTHEPSLLVHRLPRGSVFVADAGMVGPLGGVQGIGPAYYVHEMAEFREPHSFELASGPLTVGGIILEIAEDGSAMGERVAPTLVT